MLFSVPQYINVEDKVAGPLTAKQLGWLIVLLVVLVVLYSIFEFVPFLVIAVPVSVFFVALAFFRPGGIPMLSYLSYLFSYLFHPKVYVWRRPEKDLFRKQAQSKKAEIATVRREKKVLTPEDIAALAQTLDSEGQRRSERFLEIIAQQQARSGKR